MRAAFIDATTALLDDDPRTALVLADISASQFAPANTRHPERVLNVGIREQLMIGVAGGLALTGLRPIAHSYATFLVDRTYEQIKLDLDHQGVGAVLVSIGASYDGSREGRTHQSPGDVALFDTLVGGWTVRVPGHPDEVAPLLRAAATTDDPVYLRLGEQRNAQAYPDADRLRVLRRGGAGAPLVVAVGPMLDPTLAAVEGLDVTVAYTHTPRPFDAAGLRALAGTDVVLVEPYLAGTSSAVVGRALADVPHRLLTLGVGRADLRRYGDPADHARWHGLDAEGLRRSLDAFLGSVRR
ncbi:transketolase [Micromonospora sp. STR1_7]|uniref:Transketolase n=1 Tax=Micromonospora parastrephiae TaxID=2806101 RepID=A0ABS1XWH2_9ACTN|nr:transketolase [Micromonospora parastrephiae]MBM0233621.1 transketolase [Micromonospora parastrephiae]